MLSNMEHESNRGEGRKPLRVRSLKELFAHEGEVVERINEKRHGGRLALLDPLRLLRDVEVELSPEALDEAKRAYPEFFAVTRGEGAYELVARSRVDGDVRITIEGLIRKGAP